MNQKRPKNLNLFTIQFPIPAIVSILHRLTGVFLFLLIPFLLWGLQYSLKAEGFHDLENTLGNAYIKFVIWLFFIPFFFHLVAGVRHLLSDIHIGDTLKLGRFLAWLTFAISGVLIVLAGIWLW